MAGATTTFKITATEYQLLMASLKLAAGQITRNDFNGVLRASGWKAEQVEKEGIVEFVAEQVINAIS